MAQSNQIAIQPLHIELEDFKTPERFQAFQDWMQKVTDAINVSQGVGGGPIPIHGPLNLQGNAIIGVGTKGATGNPTDVLTLATATPVLGPAAVSKQLEATGSSPLQTVRRLNDQQQRENFSTFLNNVTSTPPGTNNSTATVVNNGGTTTITFTAGNYTLADQTVVPYATRSDTVANPGAAQTYYYYFRKSDATLQMIGPFAQNTSQNSMPASFDGRGLVGFATVNNGGGGTAGGGSNFGAGRGCLEIGTPISIPEGKQWSMQIEPCSDWIVFELESGRKITAARDTQVAVLKKVQDLDSGDLCISRSGGSLAVVGKELSSHESFKMKMTVEGRMYIGGGIWVANWKSLV